MGKRVSETLADRGEFGLIEAFRARLPTGPAVELGPGDDAAVIAVPDGRTVATTDVLVEGEHFRRDWSSAYEVGRKAAAQNLADIAAMGGRPLALLVGLAAPADLPFDWAVSLVDGLRDEADTAGATIAGGDVVTAPQVVVSITALGTLDGQPPLTRAGARPGDVVAVCGRLGWSAAGLAVLRRGFRSPRAVVEAHRQPAPPYAAGPEAYALGATALIDVSDGLLSDLGHVARASGVRIDLDSPAFELPEPLVTVATAIGGAALGFVLTGGEDHALAGCFPSDVVLPEHWSVVGRVLPIEPAPEADTEPAAVTVDGLTYGESAGHEHFRG